MEQFYIMEYSVNTDVDEIFTEKFKKVIRYIYDSEIIYKYNGLGSLSDIGYKKYLVLESLLHKDDSVETSI